LFERGTELESALPVTGSPRSTTVAGSGRVTSRNLLMDYLSHRSICCIPGNKQQRNACSNYAPLERTVLRTRSVTNKQTNKTNTIFSHLQPARIVRSSPNFAWW